MKTLFLALAAVLFCSAAVVADIPRPDTTPHHTPRPSSSISTDLDISLDRDAKEARLIIPRSQLKQLRAELDQIDTDGNTAAVSTGSISRIQTIVSGIFLSLAIVFAGVWFARSGKRSVRAGKTLIIATAAAAVASAATLVYANAGPPAEARSITGKMFSQALHIYGFGYGKVKLEVGNGERIKLIVPNPQDKPAGEE